MNQFTASLWGDEAWAATLAVKPVWQIIQIVSRDTSPPLYYLLEHFWMQIFGTSEVAIRSLSFFFFLATVLTVYLIGSFLWGKKTGVLAATLTLVNPFLFQYGFEGRMYSLLLLTSTLSVYFFLKKQKVGFVLATAAALYTHHFSIFVVFFEALWTLGENLTKSPKEIFKKFLPLFAIGLLYLPWFYPLYRQTSMVAGGFWLGKPNLTDVKELISKFLVGPEKGILQNISLVVLTVALLLRSWTKDLKKSFFLVGWFFTPIILTFILSQRFQSIFYDRYMLMSIPAVALLFTSLRRKFSIIFITLAILLLSLVDYHYFTNPIKRPFRELATYVKNAQKEGDFLINYSGTAHHLFESKYYGLPAPIYTPGSSLPFYTGTALMTPNDTIKSLPTNIRGRVGVIGSGDSQQVKVSGYTLSEEKHFGSLFFLWFTQEKSKI